MVRTLLVLGFVVFSVGAAAQQKPPVNQFAQSMVDFQAARRRLLEGSRRGHQEPA